MQWKEALALELWVWGDFPTESNPWLIVGLRFLASILGQIVQCDQDGFFKVIGALFDD